MMRYATAHKDYVCARCNHTIPRGTVYARLERPPLCYHRACARNMPHYDDHVVDSEDKR